MNLKNQIIKQHSSQKYKNQQPGGFEFNRESASKSKLKIREMEMDLMDGNKMGGQNMKARYSTDLSQKEIANRRNKNNLQDSQTSAKFKLDLLKTDDDSESGSYDIAGQVFKTCKNKVYKPKFKQDVI